MKSKNKKAWLLIIPIILIVGFIFKDSLTQKSIADLKGDFKEVAFVRNEQNKGGIIRIYAISVGDIANADYEGAADLFPTNDYGSSTTLYFFDKNFPFPTELTLESPHFDLDKYKSIMIIKRTGSK
ncbi:hypothetical protein [Sphingobacterium spiritivorum]|uniref:hypothetical protein n=1 Tax=Sphingobacterium spiritivorum TaxID=258 RepID=UPI00191858E3|nr:hypothetical protein [Sphingobacterium spiritivorum]QQT26543.1 hypothetical protein I6J02_01405 [Sphingobacterium spiritivorum]